VTLISGAAAEAAGQTSGRVAIGASVSSKQPSGKEGKAKRAVSFLWRLGQGSDGWGWKAGTNWYSARLDRDIAGAEQAFGDLRVRPFMIGYGYSHRLDERMKVSVNVLSGYALTSFSMQPGFNDAYRHKLGADAVSAKASNTFVVKPEVSAWLDVSRKIGIHISGGYMLARPSVTLSSSLGDDRRRVRADALMIKVGAAYSIF
jgi:hypothetical protein